jgi:hypothetical protein
MSPRTIAYGAVIAACFASGWYVNGLIWEGRSEGRLKEQEARLAGECLDRMKLTKEIDNATLSKLRARDNRVADFKRLHPAPTCVPITRATGVGDAAGGGRIDDRPHAVTDITLVDYAAVAEQYRVQLIGCQNFINRVWESQ